VADIVYDNDSIRINTIDENQTPFAINGHQLKVYHKPLSKEDFAKNVLQSSEMKLVRKRVSPPTDLPQ
jgi:hypothetical protein